MQRSELLVNDDIGAGIRGLEVQPVVRDDLRNLFVPWIISEQREWTISVGEKIHASAQPHRANIVGVGAWDFFNVAAAEVG